MALLNHAFPGSYTTVEAITIDLKAKRVSANIVTYESAAKKQVLQSVPHQFTALPIATHFRGIISEIPSPETTDAEGYYLFRHESGHHLPLRITRLLNQYELHPAEPTSVIRLPDGSLWAMNRSEKWEQVTPLDVFTVEDFDALFSIEAMDQPGANIVKHVYKLLKGTRLYSAAGSDA